MNIYRTFSLEQIRRKFVTIQVVKKIYRGNDWKYDGDNAIYFFRDTLIIGVVSMKWNLIDVTTQWYENDTKTYT